MVPFIAGRGGGTGDAATQNPLGVESPVRFDSCLFGNQRKVVSSFVENVALRVLNEIWRCSFEILRFRTGREGSSFAANELIQRTQSGVRSHVLTINALIAYEYMHNEEYCRAHTK